MRHPRFSGKRKLVGALDGTSEAEHKVIHTIDSGERSENLSTTSSPADAQRSEFSPPSDERGSDDSPKRRRTLESNLNSRLQMSEEEESTRSGTGIVPPLTLPLHGEKSPRSIIAHGVERLFSVIGENSHRPGLVKTPFRHADAMLELTRGYKSTLAETIGDAIFPVEDCPDSDATMVVVRDIPISSLCEHHLLPFFGVCAIGYIPKKSVLGLSKLSKVAELYARRLQIQERLCHEIADGIEEAVEPRGVAVWIKATHMCMTMRGVSQPGASTITTHFSGEMTEKRQEFLAMLNV